MGRVVNELSSLLNDKTVGVIVVTFFLFGYANYTMSTRDKLYEVKAELSMKMSKINSELSKTIKQIEFKVHDLERQLYFQNVLNNWPYSNSTYHFRPPHYGAEWH